MPRSQGPTLAILALAVVLLARPAIDAAGGGGDAAPAAGDLPVGGAPHRPLATAAGRPAEPPPAPPLRIRGGGWGHATGLSQYGARAQALDGRSAAQILRHYYPGVDVGATGSVAPDHPVRVGLFEDRIDAGEVHLAARGRQPGAPTSPVRVRVSPGQDPHELPAGEPWRVRFAGGAYEIVTAGGDVVDRGPGPVRAEPAAPAGPNPGMMYLPQLGSANHLAGTFQWGHLEITQQGGRMRPVLVVGMEEYLRGLDEMPSAWEPAALQAQAIIGRTYAVRRARAGPDPSCDCHLGATQASQVYRGYEKEGGPAGHTWVAAVRATQRTVVTFRGRLAETVYSSSHAGRSEHVADAWTLPASPAEHPYLRSVADPWSLDARVDNPHASWTVEVGNQELAQLVAAETAVTRIASVGVAEATAGGTPKVLDVRGWDAAGNRAREDFRGEPSAGASIHRAMRQRQPQPVPSQQLRAIGLEPFTDDDGSLHEYNIWAMAQRGVTTGCAEGRYCPDDTITRAEMASFLARAVGLEAPGGSDFADAASSVHAGAIDAIAEVGLTEGCAPDRYCPDEPLTRGQMATYLGRAFALPDDAPEADAAADFTDVAGTVHERGVDVVAAAGITSGCAPDRYCPREPVTRAQMASFLARALGVGW